MTSRGSALPPYWRVPLLTGLSLVAFAANSLLCRAALRTSLIDPAGFTLIRIASGAAILALLVRARDSQGGSRAAGHGSWLSALALAGYAGFFSFAYVRIGAGVGALILFAAVQVTMIGWSMLRSEFPSTAEFLGLAVAIAGLAWLTLPHAAAPDTLGALLMGIAGVAWGVYSLRGRRVTTPVRATAANFAMAAPITVLPMLTQLRSLHLAPEGLLLAVVSGAVTSGLGYVLWYTVLPPLGATRAAILQLLVPVLAVAGSVAFLGEALTRHVAASGAVILLGVLVAVAGRRMHAS
jgi:drug/metabolite transporter (DMT)-like permease